MAWSCMAWTRSRFGIRLDGEPVILRPFAHRAVVKRKIVVAQLVQQEEIDGGGDAAAAIAHHALVLADALALEFCRRIGERNEVLALGVDKLSGGDIHAARYPPRPAVTAGLQPLVKLRAQGVDDHGAAIPERRRYASLVDEQTRPRRGLKACARVSLRRPALERAGFRLPFVEAAIQNGRSVESDRAQHPPKARRPHHAANAVKHDPCTLADAMAGESRLEPTPHRHHESQSRGPIGELAL